MSIKTRIDEADDSEMAKLARAVLHQYLSVGFQTLQKRDLDLLLFYRMEQHGLLGKEAPNYDVARLLNLTPQRVASLRRDAYARWAEEQEIIELVQNEIAKAMRPEKLKSAMNYGSLHEKSAGWFPLAVEHPAARAEVEAHVKRDEGIVIYERNREVIQVQYPHLLSVFFTYQIANTPQSVVDALNSHFREFVEKECKAQGLGKRRRPKVADAAQFSIKVAQLVVADNPPGALGAFASVLQAITG